VLTTRIRPRQAHRTAAFGPSDTGKHRPAIRRWAEFGSFHTGNWNLSLALEDVWSIHAWVALRVKPDQFFLMRPLPGLPGHRARIARLYHIGASTHPGPGLYGTSGLLVAKSLLGSRAAGNQ